MENVSIVAPSARTPWLETAHAHSRRNLGVGNVRGIDRRCISFRKSEAQARQLGGAVVQIGAESVVVVESARHLGEVVVKQAIGEQGERRARVHDALKRTFIRSVADRVAAGIYRPVNEVRVDRQIRDVAHVAAFVDEAEIVGARAVAVQIHSEERLVEVVDYARPKGGTA